MSAEHTISRWDMPSVSGRSMQAHRPGKTVSEIEEVERAAYEEAFAKGHEAGLAVAKAESEKQLKQQQSQVDRLEAALGQLAQPLAQVDAEVEQQLMTLALTIARQLVRRELKSDPAQVIAIVRETVGLLPAAAREVRVHLHPDDAAVVRERLAAPTADRAWTMVEDPVMTRGGCKVTTDTALIDARVETRLNEVIAAMLGEERTGGRTE